MHEWALAEAVIEAVKQEQERAGRAVQTATLHFGELQGIDQDVFRTGLDQILKDDMTLRVDLRFESEAATFRCSVCNTGWALADCDLDEATREAIHFLPEVVHSFVSCPSCRSADFRVEKGRGVSLEDIEFAGGNAE